MVGAAIGLVYGIRAVAVPFLDSGMLLMITTGGAQSILVTIAGSMITVAGVVFSVTMLVLSQASSQFGPRLIRNFMRHTSNQIVLGAFIATFIFCLLSVALSGGPSGTLFIKLQAAIGLVLSVGDLLLLIYFIHRTSQSIQANNVIAEVAVELEKAIVKLFPEEIGEEKETPREKTAISGCTGNTEKGTALTAGKSGYLQAIDSEGLIRTAVQNDIVIKLEIRPGHFITTGSTVAYIIPASRADEDIEKKINSALLLGSHRNQEQDVEFAVGQLVEVASRALSPGINDFQTAIVCIDWLGSSLSFLAQRKLPSKFRYDTDGALRVITQTETFTGAVDAAFKPLRQFSLMNLPVALRLLEIIAIIGRQISREEDRRSLISHVEAIQEDSIQQHMNKGDLAAVEQRAETALEVLQAR